jgi:hypothetical protein
VTYFNDPAQELFLELERLKSQQDYEAYQQFATPDNAAALVASSLTYPGAASPLHLAMVQGGIPAGDPLADQLVYADASSRTVQGPIEKSGEGWWDALTGVVDEWVVNPIQGVPRWTFAAWDGIWNLAAGGAPIRAAQLSSQQGIEYGEAWRQQDPYFFEALGGLFTPGERVNLGSGWLPNSDVAPEVSQAVHDQTSQLQQELTGLGANERYAAELTAAPQIWRNAIEQSATEQAELGKPLTQLHQVDAESVLFNMQQGLTPWSPGRIIAANIVEPGTKPFTVLSGFGDFTAQVALDPVEWAGLWWAKSGKIGRAMWGEARRTANASVDIAERPARALGTSRQPIAALPAGQADETASLVADLPIARLESSRPDVAIRLNEGDTVPWWLTGQHPQKVPAPWDPPDWFIDLHRSTRQGAQFDHGGIAPIWKRNEPGIYEADLPRLPGQRKQKLVIQRKGKGKKQYWEIVRSDNTRVGRMPDDPRFSTPQKQFRTLKEAQEVAHAEVARYMDDDLRFGGMTAEEFLDSGEDFYIYADAGSSPLEAGKKYGGGAWGEEGALMGDQKVWRGSTRRTRREEIAKAEPRTQHKALPKDEIRDTVESPVGPITAKKRGHPSTQPSGMKMRVFGRTLDLSEGTDVAKLPEEAKAALRRDHKLVMRDGKEVLVGFGTNDQLGSFRDTVAWARRNGYGKVKWGDDDILLIDDFVGGNHTDPLGRIWFEDAGTELAPGGITAGDVRSFIDEVGEAAARSAEDVMDEPLWAEQVRQVGTQKPLTFKGVRVDYDPRFRLRGKRADKFIEKMWAGTRKAKQEARRAAKVADGVDPEDALRASMDEALGDDIADLDEVLKHVETKHERVPNDVRSKIFESRTPQEAESHLAKWLTDEGPMEVLLPGGAHYGRLADMGIRMPKTKFSDNSWFARHIAMQMNTTPFNMLEDPTEAYSRVVEALPHYRLARGQEVRLFDDAGEFIGETMNVEDILTRIRTLDPHDSVEAYAIMGDWNRMMFSSLREAGIDPRLANHAAKWYKDMGEKALYMSERFGDTRLTDGNGKDMAIVNDELVGGTGPQVGADLWSGSIDFLASPRDIKRIAADGDGLGRVANAIANKKVFSEDAERLLKIEERALVKYYDWTVTNLWKPFVLLRGAWTLRILMDDQMRVAGDGYSILNHPLRLINYAMTRPQDWRDAFRKGFMDINGVRINVNNLDEMDHAVYLANAMMRNPEKGVGVGAYGRRFYTRAAKGDRDYIDGLGFEMERMNGSVTTKVLAHSTADDPVEETAQWLMGNGRKGFEHERNIILELHSKEGLEEVHRKLLANDPETWYNVVSKQNAALHHRTGGEVVLHTGDGRVFDFNMQTRLPDEPIRAGYNDTARWEIRSQGDRDILDIIGREAGLSEADRPEFLNLLRTKVDAAEPGRFPQFTRVARSNQDIHMNENTMSEAVSMFYQWFMTKPSDALSRVPEFRRAYWEKIGDLYPYMDDATRKVFMERAPESSIRRGLEKAKRITGVDGQISGAGAIDRVDELAKAFGLTRVEATLFDLSHKRNISDSLRLIFPFVEAYGEFISRWGRIMVYGDRNIANARRFQQIIQGARSSGFFYENEFGQEVFNYPSWMTRGAIELHNKVNNLPIVGSALGEDVPPDMADNLQATGSVESLNFASGVIPGFGPVFQMGVKTFLPEDPKFDWIRDIVAPYGTEGGYLGSVAPAWFKRVLSAYGGQDDPQLNYTWTSTVIDVQRTMIDNGEYAGVTSQQELAALNELAEERAKGLLMVRAAATYFTPVSPSVKFVKEDKHGMLWSYSNLGREFYDMAEALGDEAAAFDEFYRRFGFLPAAFSGGKTYSIHDRSLTEEGSEFERAQPALFTEYPNVAMYLDPTIGTDGPTYDHSAMLRQLRLGNREGWTAEQFTYLQQDQMGDLWWENKNRQAVLIEDSATRKAFLATARSEIETHYPYWNKPVPGKVLSVTNDEQMAEMDRLMDDPAFHGLPVVDAAIIYDGYRQEVLRQLEAYGASTIDGPKSMTTDAGRVATYGRGWLRQKAEELEQKYPEFGPLFRSVYSSEVATYHDQPEPPTTPFAGGSDIFEELELNAYG